MREHPPEGFKEALYTRCQTHFSFWDRLKILIGYTFESETCTYLEFAIDKRLQGETRIMFLRPRWFPKPKPVGYMVESSNGKNKVAPSDPVAGS